jgi:hypothetical protein
MNTIGKNMIDIPESMCISSSPPRPASLTRTAGPERALPLQQSNYYRNCQRKA